MSSLSSIRIAVIAVFAVATYAIAQSADQKYVSEADVQKAGELSADEKQRIFSTLDNRLSDVRVNDLIELTRKYADTPGAFPYLRVLAADPAMNSTVRERATIWIGVTKTPEAATFLLKHLAVLKETSERLIADETSETERSGIRMLLGATIIGLTRAGQESAGAEMEKACKPDYWAESKVFSAPDITHLRRLAHEALAASGSDAAVRYFANNSNRSEDIDTADSWLEKSARAKSQKQSHEND